MLATYESRPWVPADVESFIATNALRYAEMSLSALEEETQRLVEQHERFMDTECLQLNAASNILNPKAARLLGSTLGNRPNLGYPGKKYNKGMKFAEQLEIILMEKLKQLFGAKYAEIRVPSGAIANLYVYMATTRPGDPIMVFPPEAAGHATHHQAGAAGLYGLDIHYIPFAWSDLSIDAEAFAEQARAVRPKLIIIGGSMCLFPYDLSAIRRVADEIGAWVMFDAAHVGGMIAGGEFQQPLAEGADVMTGSTYKSFGGPPSGMVLTNSAVLAERLDRIAFPGLTANFDLGRTAAMIIAVLDMLEFGPEYARMCVRNAQALGSCLSGLGCDVFEVPGKGHTQSHHLALPASRYRGGDTACSRLEQANIIACGIDLPLSPIAGEYNAIRLGTQEVTRWGMEPGDMERTAELISRVLVRNEDPAVVRTNVKAFRAEFNRLHYVRR